MHNSQLNNFNVILLINSKLILLPCSWWKSRLCFDDGTVCRGEQPETQPTTSTSQNLLNSNNKIISTIYWQLITIKQWIVTVRSVSVLNEVHAGCRNVNYSTISRKYSNINMLQSIMTWPSSIMSIVKIIFILIFNIMTSVKARYRLQKLI